MGPLLVGCGCGLIAFLVLLLIYSAVIRAAVWIANKCLGDPGARRSRDYDDEYDDWDDYDRPRRSQSAIPEPSLGKGMGIAFVAVMISAALSFAIQFGLAAGGPGGNPFAPGGGNPFRGGNNPFGGGGADPALALGASCFQVIAGFFIWAGLLTMMLPTSFPRGMLVTVFIYLIGIAIGVIIFAAIFAIAFAVGAGGGFR